MLRVHLQTWWWPRIKCRTSTPWWGEASATSLRQSKRGKERKKNSVCFWRERSVSIISFLILRRHFDQKGGWNMAHGARKLSWCSSEGNRKKCSFEGCTSYDQKGCFHMALRERLSDAASKDAPIKPKTKAFVERMEQRNIRLYLQPQGDMRNTNSFLSSGFIGTYLTVALLDHCAMRSYKLLTCPGCIVSPLYHVWYKLPLFGQTWYIPRSCISF